MKLPVPPMRRVRVGAALNQDHVRRDALLGLTPGSHLFGNQYFEQLDVVRLRALIDEHFLDGDSRHARSPSATEFLGLMERWPALRARGFAVKPGEPDYRVAVVGLEGELEGLSEPEREGLREEFDWLCGDAVEYYNEADYVFAWWG